LKTDQNEHSVVLRVIPRFSEMRMVLFALL